ncbi:MAG: DegT/DnrJ/EryC1/StrS aminotransferase family protein [Candidatus Omnitrophica bacterium]|nr:DegT/DnrJ/EryC1/StrS aminotransferase family protein [Candidatus Omnitrophota bacterium]
MGIFKEIPPTAGFPLSLKDFSCLFKTVDLQQDFSDYLGSDCCRLTYSGTAALYLILETLKDLSVKATVVIPSFVCPLVPLAIKRAGLKVEVCDVRRDSFDFDLVQLEDLCLRNGDIAAIVAVHLAGLPADIAGLKKAAGDRGIFIIEDCAQSLGAIYEGRKTGTLGDFSFFSLCRGKGLTIYEGGVAVASKKEYAAVMDGNIKKLIKRDLLSEALKILELLGYGVFYRPQLFWFVFRLPQLLWEMLGNKLKSAGEDFAANFPIHKVSRLRSSIGHAQFARLESQIEKQREKARFYIEALRAIQGIKVIGGHAQGRASYPYLSLIFESSRMRDKVLQALKYSGLGVSQIYAYAIGDYGYLKTFLPQRKYPGASYLAEHTLTLSTSAFLENKDLQSVVDVIKNLSGLR